MFLDEIRTAVDSAKAHEEQTQHLANILAKQLATIHRSIKLPSDTEVQSLVNFIVEYIQQVPAFLEAVYTGSERAGIIEYVGPFLQIAEDYFLNPPEGVDENRGLDALMDEAYLAHRLLEELNDRYILKAGIPMIPMNMTVANLIIHNLIGEPFANKLDMLVEDAAQKTIKQDALYHSQSFRDFVLSCGGTDWDHLWQHWPCLSSTMGINLDLTQEPS